MKGLSIEMSGRTTNGQRTTLRGEVLTTPPRPLSLVVHAAANRRAWAETRSIRFVGIDGVASALADPRLHVARAIIDERGTAYDFTRLLVSVPTTATADLLWITQERSFLSTVGRGGDRALFELGAGEVHSYLSAHELLDNQCEIPSIAA